MANQVMGMWGAISLAMVMAGLGGAFGCSSGEGDGSGGGGTGGGSGGGSGGGTGGGSGGGTGGRIDEDYPCNEDLVGAGGAIYLPNCDEWLGVREGQEIDFSCGQGGQGGGGGEGGTSATLDPALQRVCENGSNPDFNRSHPVYHCLTELTDDVCSSTHTSDVVECLTQEAPCNQDLDAIGCTDIIEDCEAVTASACYWAMTSARDPDFVEDCLEEPRSDETCVATFMRCAWGL